MDKKTIIDIAFNSIVRRTNSIDEVSTINRGSYSLPLTPGVKYFKKNELAPYEIQVSKYDSADLAFDSYDGSLDVSKSKANKIEKISKKISKYLKNHPNNNDDDGDVLNQSPGKINEDLGVWFGTKTKSKGSSQPKGPWVNICKKVDGKHPPCGRNQATDKAYPKCRAAGVAGKMSDSQKRSACSQKRKAEKSHPKTGTGNSPKMVAYRPRKK